MPVPADSEDLRSKLTAVHPAQVTELRKRTAELPDDYFVVLIGDLVTEEALPTYMAMLNTLDGVRDETGAAPTPWARSASFDDSLLHVSIQTALGTGAEF